MYLLKNILVTIKRKSQLFEINFKKIKKFIKFKKIQNLIKFLHKDNAKNEIIYIKLL